jgi:large-conductance mechanosensitive channel
VLKRLCISFVLATACTVGLFLFTYHFSGTAFARIVVSAGEPLSWVLLRALPHNAIYALVPEGGAAATATVFALSALVTWVVVFWLIAHILLSHFDNHSYRKSADA